MAMVLIQGGTTLYKLSRLGALQELTLPDGVSLSDSTPPRWFVFGDKVGMVNSPTRPITIDAKGIVRPLTPLPPGNKPTLANGSGAGLTGAYMCKYTHAILDNSGNVVAESDYSPASDPYTAADDPLAASQINPSQEGAVNARKLYRTVAGGAVYFGWVMIDGNIVTAVTDALPDEGLQIVAAATLGTAPDMVLASEFRGRVFGVSRDDVDNLRYSQAGTTYAWPVDNKLAIPGAGYSDRGIVGLLRRKEALGVGRANSLYQITGTDTSSFRPVVVHDQIGVESHESIAIRNDMALFLSKVGVCKWDAEGVKVLSDGRTRNWFTSDTYFNRALFARSFGFINPQRNTYQLYLCGAGSPIINRWIEYDLRTGRWWGPHKTAAFDPTSAMLMPDENDLFIPLVGSFTGDMWKEHAGQYDNVSTAIEFDVIGKEHDRGLPDLEKFWGEMTIHGKPQTAAGTYGDMTVTPYLGYTGNMAAGEPIAYSTRKGRHRVRRLGQGIMCKLRFYMNTANKPIELYGYEIPGHTLGRR